MDNLFSFPYYFYSSLCCPKEKFIEAWNSIPVENKRNINIRAAVGMTCIKLSDDLFYKDFNLSEDCFLESKKLDIVLNVDDIFSCTIYEGYEKIIQEQNDELRQPCTADELIDILKREDCYIWRVCFFWKIHDQFNISRNGFYKSESN